MSATYWIAKYVEDPFRNETRNVGVIVSLNGVFAARFIGERDDGVFDTRKTKAFLYPAVFAQWREFWRTKVAADDIDAVIKGATANFFVTEGGEVEDTGSDRAADVCHFLFGLLVGGGVTEAFDWDAAEDSELDLASDIIGAFENSSVMADGQLLTQHPVVKDGTVLGTHVTHKPSFSQRNGRLYIMEHIDLSSAKINKSKERAGWMAYMFSDIKGLNTDAQAYSLIRPERENAGDQIAYAKSVLAGESSIINWMDPQERNRFLEERKIVAGIVPAFPPGSRPAN